MAVLLAAAALLVTAIPLPRFLEVVRPDFLALTVIWLCLMAPRTAGLFFAFFCGLLLDSFKGVVIGQHALALATIAFLTLKFHLRIRMFPIGHQALIVLMLLAVQEFLLFWIDGLTGHTIDFWARWLPVVAGAMIWPVLVGLLDRLRLVR